MRRREMIGATAAIVLAGSFSTPPVGAAGGGPLLLGVTTSTDNSGLIAHLLQRFRSDHNVEVRAVTAGTGALLNMASRGDVSAVLVHAPEDEARFVAEGYGVDRRAVMHNRFLIIGPKTDPAGIGGETSAAGAFAAIASHGALFLSRGDESGTHKAEQRLWQKAGIDPGSEPSLNAWYRESGSGQGATLNIAVNLGAYVLTDEATWASFQNRSPLTMLFDRDETAMHNPYSIILTNPERFPKVNAAAARLFADWLTSARGQKAISTFKINGQQPFRTGRNKPLAG